MNSHAYRLLMLTRFNVEVLLKAKVSFVCNFFIVLMLCGMRPLKGFCINHRKSSQC